MKRLLCVAMLLLAPLTAAGQDFRVYVGRIAEKSVLIAWGTTTGKNTIGRTSKSFGKALVKVGERSAQVDRNWAVVEGLKPDTEYGYEVWLGARKIGNGQVRTYPEKADKLCFFVIGDFGNGSKAQYAIADAMWAEYQKRAGSDSPVRFVLTVGDNIYGDVAMGFLNVHSGDEDWHWERKFFLPYRELLRRIPFYPTLGNHDGNQTENAGDLPAYLDNFFFPADPPARWYKFQFGGLAEFFALDTGIHGTRGRRAPVYLPKGEQSAWLAKAMGQSQAPWKIPYFHHPPYNAGPYHRNSYPELRHWVDLFRTSGVKTVFNGHEHNFQFSERDATGGVLYVITGAGGELRSGDVTDKLAAANMAGWAAQHHFCVVEIAGKEMHITPVSYAPMAVTDKARHKVGLPLEVKLQ